MEVPIRMRADELRTSISVGLKRTFTSIGYRTSAIVESSSGKIDGKVKPSSNEIDGRTSLSRDKVSYGSEGACGNKGW